MNKQTRESTTNNQPTDNRLCPLMSRPSPVRCVQCGCMLWDNADRMCTLAEAGFYAFDLTNALYRLGDLLKQ